MRNKQPDKLSVEVSMAIAANMSYGKWKAMQKPDIKPKPQPKGEPCVCKECGKVFIKPKRNNRVYCSDECRNTYGVRAYQERRKAVENKK